MKLPQSLTPRQLLFDGLIASVVIFVGLIGTVAIGDEPSASFSREPDVFHTILIVSMGLPLVARRLYPNPAFSVILLSWIVDRGLDYPETPGAIAVAIAFYTIGAVLDRRSSLRIGGTSAAVIVAWTSIGAATLESVGWTAVITTTISTLTPLLVGREIHERRRHVEELRLRAEQIEREREERTHQAVIAERTRIARELHDVVAHQMTVMTLQAEGAKRIASDADPRLVEALQTITSTGHSALADMRRTVGLLRTSEVEGGTEPLPRLSDLERLVDQVRGTGIPVSLEIRGKPVQLSEATELSAFRIVQESLTNTARHGGPGVAASVVVEYEEDGVIVEINDNGRGSAALSTDSDGHGLVGMRERVSVLQGSFHAGPKPGGGYKVRATIPAER